MSFTAAAKSTMLNSLTVSTMSLHSAFPGATGANELSGGTPAYARKASTVATESGGVRSLSSAVVFDVPAGSTVRWIGLWNGATFQCYSPNGGNPKEFIADPSSDLITEPAHGRIANSAVTFFGDTPPAGLTEGQVVYVRDVSVDSYKVSATVGGAAIDITSRGGSACLVSAIFEDAYATQDTHTINTFQLGLPN